MVTLTSALVMTTLFAQVSDTLPKTSYIKMMDIWFLFSIAFNFVIIMFHTLIEFSHKYKNPSEIANLESNFPQNSLPIKVSPLPDGLSSKSLVYPQNQVDPYRWPKRINRLGFLSTMMVYILFLLIFWTKTFQEKLRKETWNHPPPPNETYGYPE